MECSKDCPILAGIVETVTKLNADIQHVESVRQQNEASVGKNQATASQLASLPSTPDVAEARGLLQEAIVQTGEAQAQLTESIDLSNAAIEAHQTARDIIFSNCPGEPNYIDDPSRPGNVILACASPGVYGD